MVQEVESRSAKLNVSRTKWDCFLQREIAVEEGRPAQIAKVCLTIYTISWKTKTVAIHIFMLVKAGSWIATWATGAWPQSRLQHDVRRTEDMGIVDRASLRVVCRCASRTGVAAVGAGCEAGEQEVWIIDRLQVWAALKIGNTGDEPAISQAVEKAAVGIFVRSKASGP